MREVSYHYYERNKQSHISIPNSIAQALNWEHKDKISLNIETVKGKLGIFLHKKEIIDLVKCVENNKKEESCSMSIEIFKLSKRIIEDPTITNLFKILEKYKQYCSSCLILSNESKCPIILRGEE